MSRPVPGPGKKEARRTKQKTSIFQATHDERWTVHRIPRLLYLTLYRFESTVLYYTAPGQLIYKATLALYRQHPSRAAMRLWLRFPRHWSLVDGARRYIGHMHAVPWPMAFLSRTATFLHHGTI